MSNLDPGKTATVGTVPLGLAVSHPSTQGEMQQITNKIEKLINALRRQGRHLDSLFMMPWFQAHGTMGHAVCPCHN